MEIREYLRIIRRNMVLIVLVTGFSVIAAIGLSLATTPIYQGTAKLLLVARTDPSGGISSAHEGALLSLQLVKSFAQILESRSTAEAALRLDPQPLTPQELQGRIHAQPVTATLLINLSVEDADPVRAKRLTNSVARAFIRSVPELQTGSTLQVSLVEPALTPSEAIKPRTELNTSMGAILGLILGIGIAFLRVFLDRSVKTPEELEAATGAPVVGTIPPFKASRQPIPVAEQPRTPVAEAFRKLRTNFAFLGVDRESVCCVVTSPSPGDGKSTVVANLGIALAQAGQRVAIVDADLRRPSLHRIFGLSQRVGTTTVLLDQASVHDAIHQPDSSLPAVLTTGQLPPNPAELLGSQHMANLIAELRTVYEVILIDCPPLLPVTDPMVVSQFADGVLLIIRAGAGTKDQAAAARAACTRARATVFGAVLNAALVTDGDQPSYYAYYGEGTSTQNAPLAPVARNGSDRKQVASARSSRHLARRARSGVQK